MKTAAFSGQDFDHFDFYQSQIEESTRMMIDYLYRNGYTTILCGKKSRFEKLALKLIQEQQKIKLIPVSEKELLKCNYELLIGVYPEFEPVTDAAVLSKILIINIYYLV